MTVNISVTPPTGAYFDADNSPGWNQGLTPGLNYNFYFHVLGGQWNKGYNMIVAEKISTTVPAGVAPAYGGGWGWANGPGGQVANGLTMDTTGRVTDVKSLIGAWDNDAAVGTVLYQYTQTIGFMVQNLDLTISTIPAGSFTITCTKANPITYTTTVQQH